MRALGVDVSLRRQMDAVLLEAGGGVRLVQSRLGPDDVGRLLLAHRPDVVAIDAPPGPAPLGSMRYGERELVRLGIHIFPTPSDPALLSRPFYGWMRVGWLVYQAVQAAGYPPFLGTGPVRHRALEVFPHASALALAGGLPPPGWARTLTAKRAFRSSALVRAGVQSPALRTMDQVDAALAALTGLLALEGRAVMFGYRGEDALVVPDPAGDRLAWLTAGRASEIQALEES